MEKIVVATGNVGKLKEFKEMLGGEYEVVSMEQAGFVGDVESGWHIVFDKAADSDKPCVNKGTITIGGNYTFKLNAAGKGPTFINCDMGNSTYNDRNSVQIKNGGTGSIFGEGSFAMIVSFVSLIVSVAAIIVNVSSKKNKVSAPKTTSEDKE